MKIFLKLMTISILAYSVIVSGSRSWAGECDNWQTLHPEWIFCDDFEGSTTLVGQGRYFEHANDDGDFNVADGVGLNNSKGMRSKFQTGEVDAGSIKVGFGRNPNSYMNKGIRTSEDFREIYYRMYQKTQDGWSGNPQKLSRATVITDSNWSQAMIAHLWGDTKYSLLIDPVRCVDESNNPKCIGFNDFSHMDWLGSQSGVTSIFDSSHDNNWYCIEAHVKLNDAGSSNGVQEFWIDGKLETRKENINFVRSYTAYGINAVFFENYWNAGSPQDQERYFDNIVISTKPIGCVSSGSVPSAPTNLKVQ